MEPQPGPQTDFLSSPADIAIYGGAAGGGKTFALLLEPLRHYHNPRFWAAIFRSTYTQVTQPGGLWAEAGKLYPVVGGKPNQQSLTWKFPSGMRVSFHYLRSETDKFNYQGAQIPFIGFDELTHFSEDQFFYMLSRLRSDSGVRGYVRATTNPDPDSWVARLIDWWIGEDGYPIPERAGVVRWFSRLGDDLVFADTREELSRITGGKGAARSLTFIPAKLEDNPALEENDPDYRANLESLSYVEREQLLGGNWKVRGGAGMYFHRDAFNRCMPHEVPPLERVIRCWDRAATKPSADNPDPDWTVGVKLGKTTDNRYYVLDVVRFRAGPADVRHRIVSVAEADGTGVEIALPEDPGQAGKTEVQSLAAALSGFTVRTFKESGDKVTRALPFASQVGAGNVTIVAGDWNDAYTRELHNFDGSPKRKDDQVDASSGAFNQLQGKRRVKVW